MASKNEIAAAKAGMSLKEYKATSGYQKSKSEKQIGALEEKYMKTLKPTKEETDTNTQLSNIITSKELGVAKAEQEPMAQGFVTGQTTALEKSAALKSLPLQTKLANIQAQRQAASDVLKASLGFATGKLERQTAAEQYADTKRLQEEQLKISRASQASGASGSWNNINVGGKIYKMNSKTGQIVDTGMGYENDKDVSGLEAQLQAMEKRLGRTLTEEEVKKLMFE